MERDNDSFSLVTGFYQPDQEQIVAALQNKKAVRCRSPEFRVNVTFTPQRDPSMTEMRH